MQFSQIKQMYVWTHKTSAVRNISVVQPSRTHCDAASQETSNCSFNTKTLWILFDQCFPDSLLAQIYVDILKKQNKIKIKPAH